MPNWNDTVVIAGRDIVLTPQAGALVEDKCGEWHVLFKAGKTLHWDVPPFEQDDATPVLPRVPKGCTREQVLEAVYGAHGQIRLADNYIYHAHSKRMVMMCECGNWDEHEIPELEQATQRAKAIWAWWRANEVKHG